MVGLHESRSLVFLTTLLNAQFFSATSYILFLDNTLYVSPVPC